MRAAPRYFLILILLLAPANLFGYSVLSHEELIDISWDITIRPVLLKRFPSATEDEVQKAHAYAYGGCVIQDIGYYPFGNHEFTNLLHYVRSGDFVAWMLREARDVNEYAFALGALAHYVADIWGHPAVNAGVSLQYPKLRAKFGKLVTFEDDPAAHLKTEFSFDVLQVAKRRYISQQYHDFIGFEVSQDLLDRAFRDTYGINADDLLKTEDLTIGSFRFGVGRVIPEMTQVALATRQHENMPELNDQARKKFLYHLTRADYEKEFGAKYRRPGVFARILAFFLRIIPRFGPFKPLAYRDPTPQTEDLYFRSMNDVVDNYSRMVHEAANGDPNFPNRNLDTGDVTRAGDYKLTDEAYASLVRRLAKHHFANVTPALQANILKFFSSGPANHSLKKHKWHETQTALIALKAANLNQ
jgi:Zinc dependent phospholipase C